MRSSLLCTATFTLRRCERDDTLSVFELDGELDVHVATRTFVLLAAEMATGRHLLLCLSHLTFVDSAGLAALLQLCERASGTRCDVELFGPLAPSVRRGFVLVGLDSLSQTTTGRPPTPEHRLAPN